MIAVFIYNDMGFEVEEYHSNNVTTATYCLLVKVHKLFSQLTLNGVQYVLSFAEFVPFRNHISALFDAFYLSSKLKLGWLIMYDVELTIHCL